MTDFSCAVPPGGFLACGGLGHCERWVLPDWDLDDTQPLGGFLDFADGRPRLVFFDD